MQALRTNYRKLNSVTISDGYPILPLGNILDNLRSGKYYSKLDLASGYWQIKLCTFDRQKTAFNAHLGLYQFLCLPLGLKTASSMFQRVLNTVFLRLSIQIPNYLCGRCYFFGKYTRISLKKLRTHLKRAVDCGVQFKATKCLFSHNY